jgi:hypothetical protein
MSNQSVSSETILVLNDDYQYDSSKQTENAKWVDLNNVMSVKRDKTIYAVRARNTFDFTQGRNNTVFFSNTSTAYQLLLTSDGDYQYGQTFTSNIYKGFGTSLDGEAKNIFMTAPANVYGNLSANLTANLTQLGIGGSLLETNFEYGMNGSINVQSNVSIFGNILNANQSDGLPQSFLINITGNSAGMTTQAQNGNTANVDGNTCYQKLFYNTDSRTQWNRLINANINSNVCVNASTDPCDLYGNPNPIFQSNTSLSAANALYNEAYRHQFQLRKNNNSLAYQDPIYIARVSRFGKSLSDNKGNVISSNVSLHSFTGNFAAAIPSDNSLYAKGNTLSAINITGNIKAPEVAVFNSNFITGKLYSGVGGNFNGNRTDNVSSLSDNNKFYLNITQWSGATVIDYVTGGNTFKNLNGDILPSATFKKGDHPGFVQANVCLDEGYILLDRISFQPSVSNPNFIKSSKVFSGFNNISQTDFTSFDNNTVSQNYSSLWFQSNMLNNNGLPEVSAKYIVMTGVNVNGNNWQSVSIMSPNSISMPVPSGNPNLLYLGAANTVNLYLRQGSLTMDNYTYVSNKTLTGVKYLTSVPNFVSNVILPAGNITLSANVLENGIDILGTVQSSLLFNGTTLAANTTSNYNFLFSGNTDINQRVVKNANVVMTTNSANSFIASCWNYNNAGIDIYGTNSFSANIRSNVLINYGDNLTLSTGEKIKALSLNSELSNKNIQYNLEFVNATGKTNAPSTPTSTNYGFAANLSVSGNAPNLAYTIASQLGSSVLNNNQSINSMQLENVAYTEYTFSEISSKFTDVGQVVPKTRGTNFNTSYAAPSANLKINYGNATAIAEFSQSDSFINIVSDYINQTLDQNKNYTHEVICYDVVYRYNVSSISLPRSTQPFSNDALVGNLPLNPDTLFSNLGNSGVSPSNISGPLTAPIVSCYVYQNVDENNLQPETAYPFTIPNSDNLLVPNTTANNLFPGFRWRNVSGGAQYFSNKTSSQVDFVLQNNTTSVQSAQLTIFSVDESAGTMKVGLVGTPGVKTLYINPIAHGRASDGTQKYATPITCGVQGEENTYVIFMIECDSYLAIDGLTSSNNFNDSLPATINININSGTLDNSSNLVNDVICKVALRVWDNVNQRLATNSPYENYNFRAPASQFNYASPVSGTLQTTNVSLNVFSIPPSNSIISIMYLQNIIEPMLSYNSTNYTISGNTGYVAVNSSNQYLTNFAWSNNNNTNSPAPDPNWAYNMLIPAQTTRYYLESTQSGIFIDVLNLSPTSTPLAPQPLKVYRSVEWVLTRSPTGQPTQTVGRGLLSKNSATSANTLQSFVIYENLLEANNLTGSGYQHNLSANLNDLCTRCVLQSIQTNSFILNGSNNKNNWLITTKSDDLNISLVKMAPGSSILGDFVKQTTFTLTSSGIAIDLGFLFAPAQLQNKYKGSIGVITLSPVRGFTYNPSAGSSNPSNLLADVSFSYVIQPDNYALVHVKNNTNGPSTGEVLTNQDVAFTEETQVTSTDNTNPVWATSNLTLSLDNASLAYQFLSPPYISPTLSTVNFVQIGYYTNNGYGQVQYNINDFTSNYGNELETLTLDSTTQNMPILGDSTQNAWQVPSANPINTVSGSVNISWDPTAALGAGKYYVNLNSSVNANTVNDRFYFRGTGTGSLPTGLDGNTTLLLYTGLRPLILNVLDVASTSNLESVITSSAIFNWNESDANNNVSVQNIFTSTALSVTTGLGAYVSAQYYQVVLTNRSAASSSQSIIFRSNQYTPTKDWVDYFGQLNPNKNFFGSYVDASSLFNTLRLNVVRDSGINTTYNLNSTYRLPIENPQKSDDAIIAGAESNDPTYVSANPNLYINNGSASFIISGGSNPQVLGDLFIITLQGLLPDATSSDGNGFQLNINPSTLTLYTALDTDNDGEIDINQAGNVNQSIA